MAGHKKFWNQDRVSQAKLSCATLLFLISSGCSVYVLSHMAAPTLTELVYVAETTCTVSALSLYPEPVPCIIPTCGNIISQTACRQTGYCLRMEVNFSVTDGHAMDMTMDVVQTSAHTPATPRTMDLFTVAMQRTRAACLRPRVSRRSPPRRHVAQTRCRCWT